MADKATIKLEDVPDGGAVRRVIDGREIAVFRQGEELFAIDANCPHRRGPLDSGELDADGVVTCPWHGWQFDIRTGKSPIHPGQVCTHRVTREGGTFTIAPSS